METHARVGAALTTTGRAGTTRRPGSGKRDQKVYERNQCQSPVSLPPAPTWWIWAGLQRTPPAGGDSVLGISGPRRRPRGKPAAYSWRCCRGTAGHRPGQPGGGERGKRHGVALSALGRRAGPSSADDAMAWRSPRSSPRPGKPATWPRGTARPQRRTGTAEVDGEHRRSKVCARTPRVLRTRPLEHRLGGPGGEPDAVKVARPVRRAGRGNGPAERPTPRPGSTLRPHRPPVRQAGLDRPSQSPSLPGVLAEGTAPARIPAPWR